jgi:hypothetical protein
VRSTPAATESNTASKVGERLQWLQGQIVRVRVVYAEIGQLGGETFDAVYEDTVPLGREYFFVFNVSGCRRLIRTSSVVEISTLGPIA